MSADSLKSRFSSEEWARIRIFPAVVFALVAGVDADLDAEEWAEYSEELQEGALARDPLQQAMLADLATLSESQRRNLISEADTLFRDGDAADMWARQARETLEAHLDQHDYHRFVTAMVLFGGEVADASGGDDPTEVDFESTALSLLVDLFAVDLDAGTRALTRD